MYKELVVLTKEGKIQKIYNLLNQVNVRFTEYVEDGKIILHEDSRLDYRGSIINDVLLRNMSSTDGLKEYLFIHMFYPNKSILKVTRDKIEITHDNGTLIIGREENKCNVISIHINDINYRLDVNNIILVLNDSLMDLKLKHTIINDLLDRNVLTIESFKSGVPKSTIKTQVNGHPKDIICKPDYIFKEDDYLTENEKMIKQLNIEATKKLKQMRCTR